MDNYFFILVLEKNNNKSIKIQKKELLEKINIKLQKWYYLSVTVYTKQ